MGACDTFLYESSLPIRNKTGNYLEGSKYKKIISKIENVLECKFSLIQYKFEYVPLDRRS